jgi:phosphohistidine phosphatase
LQLFLVHHGEAVGADIDARRPLSAGGLAAVERLAAAAAGRGVRPAVVWHSGKLRARQTAEAFWRACNALAQFSASRDLQPDDPPAWLRDRLRGETRDLLVAGHFPHLPRLLALLLNREDAAAAFPPHGIVALATDDQGDTWRELWRDAGKSGV